MRKVVRMACAVILFIPIYVQAQSDLSSLSGLVLDPTNAVVPGASVRLTNMATTTSRETLTNDVGRYSLTLLPPGRYELRIEMSGFKTFRAEVELRVAEPAEANARLELGDKDQILEVTAGLSPLNTESTSVGTVIGGEKVPALPLNGRQFLQLALLVPGANPGGRAVQQNGVRQGQLGGLSISGSRTNNTQFLLDGVVNIDPDYSAINYSPSIDSIAEFQVQTAMAPAEYSRAAINVVSKSGSSDVHASVWEFLRNKAMDARPFNLLGDLPQYQRNQFGGNIGGPVYKKTVFGFLSYEGLRLHQAAANLTTVSLPTAAERAGDFSKDPPIKDPATGQFFQNNQVSVTRMNPLSLAAVNVLPLPISGVSYVNSSEVLLQHNDNVSLRMDFVLSSKWNTFARFSRANENANIPFTIPNRSAINDGRSSNIALGSTYIISSSVLTETRLAVSRLRLTNGLPEPFFPVNGTPQHLPQFNLGGSYPLFGGAASFNATNAGGGIAQNRNTTYQLYDNITWTYGAHSMKFGAELEQVNYNHFEATSPLGVFQFSGRFTGNAVADFLLGLSSTANRSLGPNRMDGRQWMYAVYAQDDYHLSPNLTLNLGLRYELAPPMFDRRHQLGSIDYSNVPTPQAVFANGPLAKYTPTFFVCGESGYPQGCAYTDKNNFAPRIGVSWSANEKTVVRAGAGVFYVNTDANALFKAATSLPNNYTQTLNITTFNTATIGYDIFGPAILGPTQIAGIGIDLHQRTGYSMQGNFSIQREVARNVVVEAGYIGTLGIKLEQNIQPNNAQPGQGAVDPRRPYAGLVFGPGTLFPAYLQVSGNSVPVGQINYLAHSAQSNYHSGYLRLEKRFSNGLSLLTSYTYSKAISNAPQYRNAGGVTGSENSPPQDSYNLRAERSLASFDLRHRFVNTVVYRLPFGHNGRWLQNGVGAMVLGGLEVSSIFSTQSGFPFTANIKGDSANIGGGTGGIFVRPNPAPGQHVQLSASERTTSKWFNTAAFTPPANGTFGTLGRNTIIGPTYTDLDLVLQRSIDIGEKTKVQLRGEVFNALNHSNYGIVGRILNDPSFGVVQNQFDPRQVQLGLKLIF